MLFTIALLAQLRSSFPPVDHPGAGGEMGSRLRQVCAVAGATDRQSLLKRELDLSNRVGRTGAPAGGWASLGCLRALLYLDGALAHDGAMMVAGDSWDHGAEHVFRQALVEKPDDARAATGLALLAMNEAEPAPLKEIGGAIINAAAHGVHSAPVLNACADFAYRLGDIRTARECAQRALTTGSDSAWNLMRMARLSFHDADTVSGSRFFDLAAQSAHDSLARLEVDWHLQWFLSPAERHQWAVLPDTARGHWVLDRLASRDVRDGQPAGARLAEHFNRLDYVETHFRLRVPRVLHTRALSSSVSVSLSNIGADTTIFREYNRWQVDFSDQGVVWMRFGKPDKVSFDTTMLHTEAWRYDIDGKVLLLIFQGEEFSGSAGATTLQAGVLGASDFLCGMDAWRCTLHMKKELGTVSPEDIRHLVDDDRQYIQLATTSDDNSPRGDKPIEVTSQLSRLWDPVSGAPIALVTYALKVDDLLVQRDGAQRTTLLDFDLRRWDATAARWQDTVFTRRLVLPDTAAKQLHLTGFLVTPSTPDVSSWSLVAAQPDHRRGRDFDVTTPGLGHGPVVLSDLVLGQEGQGLTWINHNVDIPLAPLNAVDRKTGLSLYYQVQSRQAYPVVRTTVAFYRKADGVVDDSAALQVGVTQALQAGINEVAPALDVSHLGRGDYRLEVRLEDERGVLLSRRAIALTLH